MSLQAVVCEPSRTGLLLLEQGIKFKTKSMGSVLKGTRYDIKCLERRSNLRVSIQKGMTQTTPVTKIMKPIRYELY